MDRTDIHSSSVEDNGRTLDPAHALPWRPPCKVAASAGAQARLGMDVRDPRARARVKDENVLVARAPAFPGALRPTSAACARVTTWAVRVRIVRLSWERVAHPRTPGASV